MNIVKFPAPPAPPEPVTARQALQNALDQKVPLTNVLILSRRENGYIYFRNSDGMTREELNWLIDAYKINWLFSEQEGEEEE